MSKKDHLVCYIWPAMVEEGLESSVPNEPALVQVLEGVRTLEPHPRLPDFDFESLKDYSRILPAMLPNFPDFCPAGNFRKSYADELTSCTDFLSGYEDFKTFTEHFRAYNFKTFLMEGENLKLFHKKPWHWSFQQEKDGTIIQSGLAVAGLMGALCCISPGNFSWHHYTVRYLHLSLLTAFHLVRKGCIYPQIFWVQRDTAQMRWLPTTFIPEIKALVDQLEQKAPEKFAFTAKDEEYLEIDSPALHVLSLFIGALLRFARIYKRPVKSNHGNLLSFFFDGVSGKLGASGHAIPEKIRQWFSVFGHFDLRSQILFKAWESGDDVSLEVFVDGARLATLFQTNDSRLVPLQKILYGVAEFFKPLEAYMDRRGDTRVVMQGAKLLQFLQDCLKKLEIMGIRTEIPEKLLHINKPKAKMRLQGSMSFGMFSAGDLLDFDWQVALGDEQISPQEFLELAAQADGLLKYKSEYIEISAQDIEEIKKQVEAPKEQAQATQSKLVQAALTGDCDGVPITLTPETKAQIDAWRGETEIPLPEGLNATLRPYQKRGYSWMYKNLEIGFGCILADDMGLGKTLQVIAYLLKIKEEGKLKKHKALVVMPAGLLCNWQVEIKKFAPALTFTAYHGGNRDLQKFNSDILLTTYATFRKDFELLKAATWHAVVIDEAQNIKNADSDQSKLLRSLQAPVKIAMSGTPVENRLMEFWTIMDFANRGFFPSAQEFREKYETPIQKNGDKVAAETFKKITAPFMLRRLKTDKNIISDLPDKIIQNEYAELTATQAALYKQTLDKFMAMLEEEKQLAEISQDSHGLFKRKGLILQMILALKQICNHPATFLKGLDERREARDERDDAENRHPEHASAKDPGQVLTSGKLQMLLDLLTSIQEQGEKTLIFTQFAEMGFLLKESIEKELGISVDFYHGGCSQTQRKNMVDSFQQDPESKVLILSLKAGGTGLNLTAASQVIHYDLWWNPAIEAQASDRAFRIGQTRNVQVHRFITKGTFEEKINALLETKKAIAEMTVSAGETWLADLSDSELSQVFRLDSAENPAG